MVGTPSDRAFGPLQSDQGALKGHPGRDRCLKRFLGDLDHYSPVIGMEGARMVLVPYGDDPVGPSLLETVADDLEITRFALLGHPGIAEPDPDPCHRGSS